MSNFLINAFALGGIFSLVAGPLGAIIIWRRLAFFGDTLSHGALLGLSLSLIFNFHPIVGIFLIAVILAVFLGYSSSSPGLATETRLAILSPGLLSLGMISFSFFKEIRFNLEGYLFGDILAVNHHDLMLLLIGEIIVLGFLFKQWRALINLCISEDLAID
jgi:zinc transport system permease protein